MKPIAHIEAVDDDGYMIRNPLKSSNYLAIKVMGDCGYVSFAIAGSYNKRTKKAGTKIFEPAITYDEVSGLRPAEDFLNDNYGYREPDLYRNDVVTWKQIAHYVNLERFIELLFENGLIDENDVSEDQQ